MKLSKETIIISVIGIIFVIGMGLLIWKSPGVVDNSQPKDPAILVRDNSHMTGVKGAKVTVVEFGDYQCPACGAASPAINAVIAKYKSNPDFNFVFRNFPLPQHGNAQVAAEAAEAAGAQGKYWEMNEILYAHQSEWENSTTPIDLFAGYAGKISGIDVEKFKADVTANKYNDFIQSDMADGNTLGIDHTPSIFLQGKEMKDVSEQGMESLIDPLLAAK